MEYCAYPRIAPRARDLGGPSSGRERHFAAVAEFLFDIVQIEVRVAFVERSLQ